MFKITRTNNNNEINFSNQCISIKPQFYVPKAEQNSKYVKDLIIYPLNNTNKYHINSFKNRNCSFDKPLIYNKYSEKKHKNNYNLNKIDSSIGNNHYPLIILKECGKTTFIITVLRCFSDIINISNYYLDNIIIITNNMNQMPISYVYTRILYHLFPRQNIPSENSYSLDKFYYALTCLNPIFKGKSTKNAIDFLIYFINKLSEENKVILGCYQKYIQNENTKIYEEFSWTNKRIEKCWACGNERISYSKYLTYDLDFENAFNKAIFRNKNQFSLLDCINLSLEKKNLYNVFCDNCNRKNNSEKITSIEHIGNNIIFLIRIENKEFINKIRENNFKFIINENIDLSKILKTDNSMYYLNGVIFYDSENLEYIAYSYNQNHKKWYKYDKEKIIPIEYNFFNYKYDYKLFPVVFFLKK